MPFVETRICTQPVRIFPARKLSDMVLIDVPDAVASAFRLGEDLWELSWSCGKTAKGVFVNLRWSSCGATKPPKNASPLNSRQRRSKRRLEEFLSWKEMKLRKELSPLDRVDNLSACEVAKSWTKLGKKMAVARTQSGQSSRL